MMAMVSSLIFMMRKTAIVVMVMAMIFMVMTRMPMMEMMMMMTVEKRMYKQAHRQGNDVTKFVCDMRE